jgi:hypothetical protein
MIKLKHSFFVTMLIACLLWLSGCNYSRTYMPELNDSAKTISDRIDSKYHFETIDVTGKKTSGTSGKHTTPTIKFVNGQGIPTDNTQMKALAKQLAIEVKKAIKDTTKFDGYIVGFDIRTVDGVVTSNTFREFDFTPKDLEAK